MKKNYKFRDCMIYHYNKASRTIINKMKEVTSVRETKYGLIIYFIETKFEKKLIKSL